MKTYNFSYEGKDGFDAISFCGQNEREALSLFKAWCDENGYDHSFHEMSWYYDPDDHAVYGDGYEWPENGTAPTEAASDKEEDKRIASYQVIKRDWQPGENGKLIPEFWKKAGKAVNKREARYLCGLIADEYTEASYYEEVDVKPLVTFHQAKQKEAAHKESRMHRLTLELIKEFNVLKEREAVTGWNYLNGDEPKYPKTGMVVEAVVKGSELIHAAYVPDSTEPGKSHWMLYPAENVFYDTVDCWRYTDLPYTVYAVHVGDPLKFAWEVKTW